MKHVFRYAFSLGAIVLALGSGAYALSLSGRGGIDFEGTGTITHMQSPFTILDVYSNNCTPSIVGDLITRCNLPIDTSLKGNGIIRAEFLRISKSSFSNFFITFGCSVCSSSVGVSSNRDLVSVSDPNFPTFRLSDEKTVALQTLINQYGAETVHMAISSSPFGSAGGFSIFSSARAVEIDIKPDGFPNRINPRSRGIIPVSILTTANFDATTIDVPTLGFGVNGNEASLLDFVLDDGDDDGDIDLLLFFKTQNTAIECETAFTFLTGATLTGEIIAGIDSVETVGCK